MKYKMLSRKYAAMAIKFEGQDNVTNYYTSQPELRDGDKRGKTSSREIVNVKTLKKLRSAQL